MPAKGSNTAAIGPDAEKPRRRLHRQRRQRDRRQRPGERKHRLHRQNPQRVTLDHPLDPRLGPLQNNGGPAIGALGTTIILEKEAPLPGSPAIDKSTRPGAQATDERGFPSVVDGKINVGAVSQARRR